MCLLEELDLGKSCDVAASEEGDGGRRQRQPCMSDSVQKWLDPIGQLSRKACSGIPAWLHQA